jgi:probable addiction module antidote protein
MRSSTKGSKRAARTTAYSTFDVADYLDSPEMRATYLDVWLQDSPEDSAGIARALGDIARASGMTEVAKASGLSRESLYRALSDEGNPSFATILRVTKALGIQLRAVTAGSS